MEIENEKESHPVHSLSLNLLIKGAQSNHGLKRGDYQQYRQYCANKIKKTRKQMKFSLATKNKFVSKKIEEERPQDPRSLQVLLFNSEKNWAHANQIKDMAKDKKVNKGNKNKHTIIKKFKKALGWARRLEQACSKHSQKKTGLEAEAYRLYLQGLVSFEVQEFGVASQAFIKCRQILNELQKVSDSVTSSILKQKIDQVQASIRYCTFRESKGKQLTINEILDMKKLNDPVLSAKLENLSQNQISTDQLTVKLGDQNYPVKNALISSQAQKIQQLEGEVQQLAKREQLDESSHENLLESFGRLFISYDQLIRVVDKEKQNSQYTQAEKENLSKLGLHFQENKSTRMLQRLEKIFTYSYKVRKFPPQTLAKLLTNMMSVLTQANQLQKDKSKLNNRPMDMEFIRRTDDLSFYYRTLRLHLVSQVYNNNNKSIEAYSLWAEAERCLEIIKSKQIVSSLLVTIEELEKAIKTGKLSSWIQLSQKQSQEQRQVTKGMENVKITQKKSNKQLDLQYLNSHPHQLSKLSLQQISDLESVKLPPSLQMIPPRPIFFDLMDQHISYPALDKKSEKQKGGWFWNKIFK